MPTSVEDEGASSEFDVSVLDDDQGWRVQIVSKAGRVLSSRACSDGTQARTYASTVRQHLYWLSAQKFAEYYSLEV